LDKIGMYHARKQDFAPALDAFQRMRQTYEHLTANVPEVADYVSFLGNAHNNVALILERQADQRAEALKGYEQALRWQRHALARDPRHPDYAERLCFHYGNGCHLLMRLGRWREVIERLEAWEREVPELPLPQFDRARIWALCAEIVSRLPTLAGPEKNALGQQCGERALANLRRAEAHGLLAEPGRRAALRQRPFLTLHAREDFRAWLQALEAKAEKPAP
jgi:hypothetical protein